MCSRERKAAKVSGPLIANAVCREAVGLPILPARAGSEEYGWALGELVQLKMESAATLDVLRQKLPRVEQIQIGLEKMRESTEGRRVRLW